LKPLTHGSLFAGIEGFGAGFEEAGWLTHWQVEKEPFCLAVLSSRFSGSVRARDITTCRGLTASLPASLAKMSRSQVSVRALRESALDSFTTLRESCANFDPLGLSSKMFPDFSVRTTAETLQKSSGFSWSSAGMGFNGVCSTASFSVSPNDANVCSLSDVLEGRVPPRFYLSPRACRGVLRRAKKRGRTLLSRLQVGLEFVGSLQDDEWKMILTWLSSPHQRGITDIPATEEMDTRSLQSEVRERERARLLPQPTNGMTTIPTPSSLEPCGISEAADRTTMRLKQDISLLEVSTPAMGQQIWLVRRLTPTECEILQGFRKGWIVPDTEHWGTRSRQTSRSGSRGASSKPTRRGNEHA
jgi:site-specific DNA-cytosine methylase